MFCSLKWFKWVVSCPNCSLKSADHGGERESEEVDFQLRRWIFSLNKDSLVGSFLS